jgi:ERCC4-type nuclease
VAKPKPNIIVDTREKKGWDWEGDESWGGIIHRKLEVGDYSIEGLEDIVTIERKLGADELYGNFTVDKERIFAEFELMKDYRVKIVMIEQTLEEVLNPLSYFVNKKNPKTGKPINRKSPKMPPAVVASNLTNLMLEYDIQVIFGGSKAQSMTRHMLLRAFDLHQKHGL